MADDAVLAAIGILSNGANALLRGHTRRSWLSRERRMAAAKRYGIVVRFVLRGQGASIQERDEAATHNDTVFVPASASLGRARGPLVSLFLWWKAAVVMWPTAEFIGKADDDAYLHLGGVAAHLRASHALVREVTSAAPRIYWGAFEAYHFDEQQQRQVEYRQDGPGRRCTRTQELVHGPFSFAKGPLYLVSRTLVAELVANAQLQAEWNTTVASLRERTGLGPALYEDVWTGYVLSKWIGGEGLALVENGLGNGASSPHYSDGYGMQLAPSTLVWHMRTKRRTTYRLEYAHHWEEELGHHCETPPSATVPWVRCGWATVRASTVSCTGARWRRCTTDRRSYERGASNCSTALRELKHEARRWFVGRG